MTTNLVASSASSAPPGITIRPAGAAELGYVIDHWAREHNRSEDGFMSRPNYKRLHLPVILGLLNREDTWVLGAHRGDKMVGWLAWTPGKLPAVHFAFVHPLERRKGIFLALWAEAMIGRRFVYTFRGARAKVRAGRVAAMRGPKARGNGPSYDERMISALARRGIYGAYCDVTTWEGTR